MIIKKILIVPSRRVVLAEDSVLKKTARFIKHSIRPRPLLYDGEMQFYTDIPKILGSNNTFMLGKYRPHFLSTNVPETAAYPSCYGVPPLTSILLKDFEETVRQVDALFVSTRADERIDLAVRYARKHDIPIAMIDFPDHESLYGASDEEKREKLFRGFVPGEHFDLFFKKELYLGFGSEIVLPLVPLPVRPESYSFPEVEKDKTIFYSGRPRPLRCQADRIEAVDLLEQDFENTLFRIHDSQSSFMTTTEYWNNIARSQMSLSPSGRSWDSFRHCEVGLANHTVLIAPKPYIETTGPELKDGYNAILYDTVLRDDGKYHLLDGPKLVEKIKYYLSHDNEREKIANQWHADVMSGHTILARSKYILEQMERVFS